MSLEDKKPLVVTDRVIKEIITEVERIFQLETDRINFTFDQHVIQITVLPPDQQPFMLPDGPKYIKLRDREYQYVR
jgi:hypothetical protein